MIPRLYIDAPLAEGAQARLDAAQAHYLQNVLRRESGAALLLFNARDGEFEAHLSALGKKEASAILGARRRAPETGTGLHLYFAPVKKPATEAIVQKATELGVDAMTLVTTERTNVGRRDRRRLSAIAREAAEQSGRLSIPAINEPIALDRLLGDWSDGRLIFCDEDAAPAASSMLQASANADACAILIGPEGGFSAEERGHLWSLPFTSPVTLGPRVLKCDTAVVAAIALWHAAREPRGGQESSPNREHISLGGALLRR